MTKVSKNIKKIRTSKNLTQDALANKLYVTRQTVSGWENGRTQPDIEMLIKIAEVLEADVEELIYGVKKNADENVKKENTRRVLTTIFAVIAAVLIGTGLVLIFITGWKKIPDTFKSVFAFIPIVAGQSAAVYTYIKHKNSVPWREAASVLWCAGIAATVALVNSVFNIDGGFANCMLIDALMFLPVIYVLDATAPLAVYYASTIGYCAYLYNNSENQFARLLMILLLAAGMFYVFINRKKADDIRYIYTLWISVIAVNVAVMMNVIFFAEIPVIMFILLAFYLSAYIFDKQDAWQLPFKTLGLAGCTVISVLSAWLFNPEMGSYGIDAFETEWFIPAVLCIACVVSVLILRIKSLKKNVTKIIYCAFAAVCLFTEIIYVLFDLEGSGLIYILILLCAFGMSVSLIAHGALAGKFAPLNLGLISTAVLIAYMIASLIEIGMFTAGILLLAFGIVMFTVNFLLAKKMKIAKKEEI